MGGVVVNGRDGRSVGEEIRGRERRVLEGEGY